MDHEIRPITIAEDARNAARIAAATLTHQPNPHEVGSDDHARWDFQAFTTGEASA